MRNYKFFTSIIFITLLNIGFLSAFATEISISSSPFIGAQIVIEKGQTQEEIDSLFSRLRQSNMTLCRIRMFESYMHDDKGNWDFSTFDTAFKAAERNNIKILATLFPYTEFTDIGGFKFPHTKKHMASVAAYIKAVTLHFKNFSALYGWVLMNEIGSFEAPLQEKFTEEKFALWQKSDTVKPNNEAGYPIMAFKKERFLIDYNTWYLEWLSKEVNKYDTTHHLHVNTHAIFDTYSEYNLTKWRGILDSFGGSAHPSWHYGKFKRDMYHYAMSINSEMIRSGAGSKPWLMTEIQGGNNIWSSGTPMCPTKQEIEQWMWTVIGTGGKGVIFWSLNPRSSGLEAGEWALLDFLNEPTDRMEMADKTATLLKKYADVFASAKVEESGVNILYTRESLWCEKNAETKGKPLAGREPGAAIKSVIGFYETLAQMGIQCNVKCIDEFDFSNKNVRNKTIIIPHQIALPKKYEQALIDFSSNGGQLIIEGLTAFFDENMHLQFSSQFPYRDLFGGLITENPLSENFFNIKFADSGLLLPSHAWEGHIQTEQSISLAVNDKQQTLASLNIFGKGEVIWIPSCVALAAHETNNYKPMADVLYKYLLPHLPEKTIRFQQFTPGTLLKTLTIKNGRIVILINKSGEENEVVILGIEENQKVINTDSTDGNGFFSEKIKLQNESTKVYLLSDN